MAIKLKPQAKAEFQRLFLEAVQLQVQLYNKLGEIEAIGGVSALSGLDAAVQQEASDWMDVPSVLPDETFQYVAPLFAAAPDNCSFDEALVSSVLT